MFIYIVKPFRVLRIVFSVLCLFIFCKLSASGIIGGPQHVCIGNLAYFHSQIKSNVNTYQWSFGDGFTSTSSSPFHLYKNQGSFKVSLTLNLNNGNSVSDSMIIEVDGLPKAELFIVPGNDSCLYTNIFKFQDVSSPSKPAYSIVKRLVLWGDGDYLLDQFPNTGDTIRHHYELKDKYKIKIEITDNRGCKSSDVKYVKVVNGTLAKISSDITYPSCGEAKVCFSNSSLSSNGNNQVYIWNFDTTGFQSLPYSAETCFSTTKSKFVTASLFLSNPDNTCKTETSVRIYLDADSLKNNFNIADSVICYGEANALQCINSGMNYTYDWKLDGRVLDYNDKDLMNSAKSLNLYPGNHTVLCTIAKGPCSAEYSANFRVKGPVARMHIFNQLQCLIDKRVFFIDTSLFLDKKNAQYRWTIIDPEGENCSNSRALNINKYKNCNSSTDWYGKHDYTTPRSANLIQLEVKDVSNGCSDSCVKFVEHFHCKLCKTRPGGVKICQYDTFLDVVPGEIAPKFFSLDTGKTWLKFHSEVPKPYKGWYGVGFIFENTILDHAEDFGDDSIKIYREDSTWMDTVFQSDFLYVKEARSTEMTIHMTQGNCKPFEAVITMKDSLFKNGDQVIIDWMDGNTENIHFDEDSIQTEFKHLYKISGMDTNIIISQITYEGCSRFKRLRLRFGKIIEIIQTGRPCKNSEICFNAVIKNFSKNKDYGPIVKSEWTGDGINGNIMGTKLCIFYSNPGYKMITLYTEDSLGCKDTINEKIAIRELKAGILQDSRVFYCNEMKQLFDSSYHVFKDKNDYIREYFWDFGSGMYTTLEKNPFRSFEVLDSLIPVKHIVEDNNGCRDTFQYELEIVGSLPKFKLIDTIGCAPFTAKFENISKKCAAYIWEFGDDNNSTFENKDICNVSFKYVKAGKYYPKMIGIDTFYNPYTGGVYYCNAVFDPDQAITVLETFYSSFKTKDTICLGETSEFDFVSNTNFQKWEFGDKTFDYTINSSTQTKHIYQSRGTYKARISPYFNPPNIPQCLDSMEKIIVVIGVVADFEIDSKTDAPIFYFNNLSDPKSAKLAWDFGQSSSGSNNYSDLQNPVHNYGTENSKFTVCLTASLEHGCKDSVCKPVMNSYQQSIKLYNVFTPGNEDDLNDEYEVHIKGEKMYHLIIYDRWGVKVYESDEDSEPGQGMNWNGKVNNTGNVCPGGTYYYIFNYSFKIDPDKTYSTNGTITLIR